MKLYTKKLISLNPDEYRYITLDEALQDYHVYIGHCINNIDDLTAQDVKSFDEWLETEI